MTLLRRLVGVVAISFSLLLPNIANAAVWTLFSTENCAEFCGCGQPPCYCYLICPPTYFLPDCPSSNPGGQPCNPATDTDCWVLGTFTADNYFCQ